VIGHQACASRPRGLTFSCCQILPPHQASWWAAGGTEKDKSHVLGWHGAYIPTVCDCEPGDYLAVTSVYTFVYILEHGVGQSQPCELMIVGKRAMEAKEVTLYCSGLAWCRATVLFVEGDKGNDDTCTLWHTHKHTLTCTYTLTCTHPYIQDDTCTLWHTLTHTHTHMYTHTHIHTHSLTYTGWHMYTVTHTSAHKMTHVHTHTLTYTHSHIQDDTCTLWHTHLCTRWHMYMLRSTGVSRTQEHKVRQAYELWRTMGGSFTIKVTLIWKLSRVSAMDASDVKAEESSFFWAFWTEHNFLTEICLFWCMKYTWAYFLGIAIWEKHPGHWDLSCSLPSPLDFLNLSSQNHWFWDQCIPESRLVQTPQVCVRI